jgi:hypothetical protein
MINFQCPPVPPQGHSETVRRLSWESVTPVPRALAKRVEFWYTDYAALTHSGNRGEVGDLTEVINFLLAVIAGIVSHYVCKWLDGQSKGQ